MRFNEAPAFDTAANPECPQCGGPTVWNDGRHGIWFECEDAGCGGKVDRGGAINTIAPTGTTSKNAVGQATSGYLVEVGKVSGEEWDEWRKANPEAFARPYNPDAGLRFEAWVVEENAK